MAYFSKVKTNALYVDKFLVNRSRDLDNRGAVLTAEHGAGAIGTAFAPRTYRWSENGHIITEIHVDLTGLACKGDAAKDAIVLAAGGAARLASHRSRWCR